MTEPCVVNTRVSCPARAYCAEEGCQYEETENALYRPSPLWEAIQRAKAAKAKTKRKGKGK